jgi:hypothetical protein
MLWTSHHREARKEARKETFIRKSIPKWYCWREPREIQTFEKGGPSKKTLEHFFTFSTKQETVNHKLLSNLSPALSLPDRQTSNERKSNFCSKTMKILFHSFLFSSGFSHSIASSSPVYISTSSRSQPTCHAQTPPNAQGVLLQNRDPYIRRQKARRRPFTREEDCKPV